jgi:AcrR family transcriptional regulator
VSGTDRRRERGQRNRAALLRAAVELFHETGFDETTVEQIAARAGVAPRTFFHHFPSKEDVLFEGYAARLQDATRRFREGSRSRSLWSGLREGADAVADSILDDPARYLERARLYDEVPALRARLLRINEEWIDAMAGAIADRLDADPATDVRPRLAATLLNGANRAAIAVWVAADGRIDLRSLMHESLDLLRPTIDRIERAAVARGTRAS